MIVDLTRELDDPSGGSLYDAWRRPDSEAEGPKDGLLPDQALAVTRIGSGSDHTVFINHVGLPVVEMGFTGPYGVYHSAYDSHHWVQTIGDPGFQLSPADERVVGLDGAAAGERGHPAD